jgi:hypothetical protein
LDFTPPTFAAFLSFFFFVSAKTKHVVMTMSSFRTMMRACHLSERSGVVGGGLHVNSSPSSPYSQTTAEIDFLYLEAIKKYSLAKSMLSYEGFADVILEVAEKYFSVDEQSQPCRSVLEALRLFTAPVLDRFQARVASGGSGAAHVSGAQSGSAATVVSEV